MSDDGGGAIAPDRPPTLVASVVKQLEALSLAHEEGTLLGAEDVLLARFGVSRPTLRQAAKVAEAERLISVRRGLRGGFYAARPDAAHAIRAPARYLRLHDATLRQMHAVSRLLTPDIAGLAAECRDPVLIGALRALRDALATQPGEADSVRDMIAAEAAVGSLMARMTANPVMLLFNQIFFAFGDLERDVKFYREDGDRRESRRLQLALCDALLAHDATAARAAVADRSALIDRWLG